MYALIGKDSYLNEGITCYSRRDSIDSDDVGKFTCIPIDSTRDVHVFN
jgi:hypothetical protein